MSNPVHGTSHRPSRSGHSESGMATGELLVLTVPLCVLSMAFASKLSSTASARMEGQWQMSLSAQQSAREPCSGNVDLRMTAPAMLALKHKKAAQALVPMLPTIAPIVDEPMVPVGKISKSGPTPVRNYYYRRIADASVPDGIHNVTTGATFVCNEPNQGDDRRERYKVFLGALGFFQAAKLFGVLSGVSDPTEGAPTPVDPCDSSSSERSPLCNSSLE